MSERTVKLTDREVRAIAYITAAEYLETNVQALFNDYPRVERASLSLVSDMMRELTAALEAASLAAVGGVDGFNALILKAVSGKEEK